jgi:hypothetical protein
LSAGNRTGRDLVGWLPPARDREQVTLHDLRVVAAMMGDQHAGQFVVAAGLGAEDDMTS